MYEKTCHKFRRPQTRRIYRQKHPYIYATGLRAPNFFFVAVNISYKTDVLIKKCLQQMLLEAPNNQGIAFFWTSSAILTTHRGPLIVRGI